MIKPIAYALLSATFVISMLAYSKRTETQVIGQRAIFGKSTKELIQGRTLYKIEDGPATIYFENPTNLAIDSEFCLIFDLQATWMKRIPPIKRATYKLKESKPFTKIACNALNDHNDYFRQPDQL